MHTRLTEGQPAPRFECIDQNGEIQRLTDYRGLKKVLLFFYGQDDTPD